MALSFFVLPAILYFAALQGKVHSQHIGVSPTYSVVKIGEPISMLCQAGADLTYCRILVPGDSTAQILMPNSPPSPKKLQYEGAGLEKGQCGFRIERAEDIHNGVFTCNFHVKGTSIEQSANMTVVVARTPSSPVMTVLSPGASNLDSYKEGDTFIAKCTVKNGRPVTNFTWYLGDDRLEDGLTSPVITGGPGKDGLLTTEQNITRILQASDNDKEIRCIADHPGLNERNNMDKKRLIIQYPPKPLDKKIERFGLVEGMEGKISVVIEANPRPSFKWNVGETSIVEGETQDRFTVIKSNNQNQTPGRWETVLVVDKLTKEDVGQKYSVTASNEFGYAVYEVEISTSPEPKTLPIGAGTVVFIVLIAVVVFIVIGGVLFARAKGKWCFSEFVPPRTAGESSDTESADHTASEVKPKRSFRSVFKKTSDRVTTIPEESPKVQSEMKPTEEANRTAKDNENSENQQPDNGEGVVYAELDIQARNTEGPTIVRGEDDKTEYAEIIHMKSQHK